MHRDVGQRQYRRDRSQQRCSAVTVGMQVDDAIGDAVPHPEPPRDRIGQQRRESERLGVLLVRAIGYLTTGPVGTVVPRHRVRPMRVHGAHHEGTVGEFPVLAAVFDERLVETTGCVEQPSAAGQHSADHVLVGIPPGV